MSDKNTIKLKRINNIDIHSLVDKSLKNKKRKVNNQHKDREILGFDFFPEPFCNVFLLAKKNSGKTTVIKEILNNILCSDLDQKVYFFVSTFDKDVIYQEIKETLKKYAIDFEVYKCIEDEAEGVNHLKEVIDSIEETDLDNYEYAENIFIFDDISEELRNIYLQPLVKENRHYKATILMSSQYITDLTPASRSQIDFCLVFKRQSMENLKRLYASLDICVPLEYFIYMYKEATKEDHNFLYIDRANSQFRFNFNQEVELPKFDDYYDNTIPLYKWMFKNKRDENNTNNENDNENPSKKLRLN